jgi:Dyp-type peroxidase family
MRPRRKIPLFALDRPLSEEDLRRYGAEMTVLQGNILKVHGRDMTASIFLTFKAGKPNEAGRFLRAFAERVTSAKEQAAQSKRYTAARKRGVTASQELFTTLCLTAAGYRFLGFDVNGFTRSFLEGMRKARRRLGDPPTATWDAKFRRPIHAMVTFAHDDSRELMKQLDDLRAHVEPLASVAIERGLAMRTAEEWTVEHFGFLDGVSQPVFFEKDLSRERPDVNWGSAAGPSLVLVKDPHGASTAECGSYFVFRKLEQNVKAFRRWENQPQLQRRVQDAGVAGALLLGRFRDGTPLALSKVADGKRQNNFTYDLDRQGNRCPLLAHIRKVNPRGDSPELRDVEKSHRIARRGITYGPPTQDSSGELWPEHGVGLLFQCCQADLTRQFEFIQRWANDPDADRPGSGQDAVIGQPGDMTVSLPTAWADSHRVQIEVNQFVRMCGGEYFFAPSIQVLKRMRSMRHRR